MRISVKYSAVIDGGNGVSRRKWEWELVGANES